MGGQRIRKHLGGAVLLRRGGEERSRRRRGGSWERKGGRQRVHNQHFNPRGRFGLLPPFDFRSWFRNWRQGRGGGRKRIPCRYKHIERGERIRLDGDDLRVPRQDIQVEKMRKEHRRQEDALQSGWNLGQRVRDGRTPQSACGRNFGGGKVRVRPRGEYNKARERAGLHRRLVLRRRQAGDGGDPERGQVRGNDDILQHYNNRNLRKLCA